MNRYMTSNAVMDIQRPVAPQTPPQNEMVPPPDPQQPLQPQAPVPPEAPQTPQSTEKHGRRKGPIIAIILVIVVVLALIGGAVFYYVSQNKVEEPAEQTPIETPVTDDGYIGPEDIDATVQKIDGALTNLNDSADFGADDLNDSTLGL